jgi:hypothetical protein
MMVVYFEAEGEGFVKHVGVGKGRGMEEEEEGVESSQMVEAVVVAFL